MVKSGRLICTALVAALSGMGLFAENSISVHQRWPWNEIVDIDVSIGAHGSDYDLVATWDGCPTGRTIQSIPSAYGDYHFKWDPRTAGLTSKTLNNFTVTLKRVRPSDRLFMAIWFTNTLDKVTAAGGTFYPGDVTYYATLPAYTSNIEQRRLLFRRVRAYDDNGNQIVYTNGYSDAILDMQFPNGATCSRLRDVKGLPLREVRFSSDYWIMTMPIQAAAAWPTCMNLSQRHGPNNKSFINNWGCNSINYRCDNIRGTAAEGVSWPDGGFTVAPNSYIGQARAWMKRNGVFEKLGSEMILDLPTSAQWETAARAGTDGNQIFAPKPDAVGYGPITASSTPGDVTNTLGNAWVDADLLPEHVHVVTKGLSIWYFNRYAQGHTANGKKNVNTNVARVDPNAWGIYDMPGIQREWALGYSVGTTSIHAGEDPVCATAGSTRYVTFGCSQDANNAANGESAMSYIPGNYAHKNPDEIALNFRLVLNTKNWLNR